MNISSFIKINPADSVVVCLRPFTKGVEDILSAVIEHIPHPEGDVTKPLQALIFDSVFNPFRGIIAYFKIENGEIRKGDKVKFYNTGMEENQPRTVFPFLRYRNTLQENELMGNLQHDSRIC